LPNHDLPLKDLLHGHIEQEGDIVGNHRKGGDRWVRIASVLVFSTIILASMSLVVSRVNAVQPSAPQSPAAPVAIELKRIALPGPVYNLAFDQARNSLWFMYTLSGTPALFQYEISSGTMTSSPLPPTQSNGFLEKVAVAPDGDIWLTEDYSVIRFDPANQMTTVATLPLVDTDATPTALTQDDLSPGTWPCDITFDSNGQALVARHNVKSLVRMDNKGAVVGRLPLPAGITNPGSVLDVGGRIHVASYMGNGKAASMDEQGGAVSSEQSGTTRFAAAGSAVVSVGASGLRWSSGVAGPVGFSAPAGPMDDLANGRSGAVFYGQGLGSIVRVTSSGVFVSVYQLFSAQVQVTTPIGATEMVSQTDQLGAMAVDADDTVWIIDIRSSQAQLIQLQM
jgi:streptogramin lyase